MPLNKPGRSGGILPYLFLYIPVVWAALLIAQSLGDGLPELLTNLTAALQTPLKIHWTGHSLMSILACTGLYVMGICLYRTTQGRTRDGEEHGSAQWASPKQVNAMFCQKQNKPLTQNVRLGHFACENDLILKEPISIIIRQNRQGGRAQDAPPPLGTKYRRKAYETPSLLGVGYAVLHGHDNSDRSQKTLSRWAFA